MPKFTTPIRYHCIRCDGQSVRAFGHLRWSDSRQEWEVVVTPSPADGHCLSCKMPVSLVVKPIEEQGLAEMRKALGLSQPQLGALMGMGANEVSRVERGTRPPPKRYRELLEAYVAGYRPADWPKGSG